MPRIDVPLDDETKTAFTELCHDNGSSTAVEIRRWIIAQVHGVPVRIPVTLEQWQRFSDVCQLNGSTPQAMLAQTVRKVAARL